MTPFAAFRETLSAVAPRAAVVFGSGLAGAADGRFVSAASVPYADVPGLVPPTVAGHGGRLAVGHWAGVPAVVCFGRVHFYEGHPWDRVTALVRWLSEFGAKVLLLTNAAGGIRDDLNPGDLMPIRGHLKWLGAGVPTNRGREESAPWQSRLVGLLESATGKSAGVYAALTGPCYETPAEIRALRSVGADAVGMSTAVEAETAVALGMTVAGVSCVTNKAAGLAAGTLSHHEVEAVAKLAVGKLGDALTAAFAAR